MHTLIRVSCRVMHMQFSTEILSAWRHRARYRITRSQLAKWTKLSWILYKATSVRVAWTSCHNEQNSFKEMSGHPFLRYNTFVLFCRVSLILAHVRVLYVGVRWAWLRTKPCGVRFPLPHFCSSCNFPPLNTFLTTLSSTVCFPLLLTFQYSLLPCTAYFSLMLNPNVNPCNCNFVSTRNFPLPQIF